MPDNKNMLNDETLEEVTGGVIPKDKEAQVIQYACEWAFNMLQLDEPHMSSKNILKKNVKKHWGERFFDPEGALIQIDPQKYLMSIGLSDATMEDFVDLVWEHRNEIKYIG